MADKSVHSTEYKRIVDLLKKARILADLNQAEVAKKLKKPQSYISKIEAGERRLDVLELKELASVYGKSVSDFVKD